MRFNIKKVTACVCSLSMIAAAVTQNTGGEFNIFDEQKVFAFVDESGIKYNELNDGTLEIVEYNGEDSVLVIPDEIDGKRVISIGNYAFSGCGEITEIILPEGLTGIGEGAFDQCSGITEITIPEGVTSIEDSIFYDCSGLTEITLPGGIKSIGDYAFSGCSELTKITLPEGLTSIGEGSFFECSGITEMTLPEGLTSIGEGSFIGCSGITEIILPKGLTSIPYAAFSGCSGLTEITIPESVTSINFAAFDDVSSELKICGTEGSYAQKYAVNNNLKFEILSVTGDVDGNGIVSLADFIKLVENMINPEVNINHNGSDMNSDGKIDSTDVIELKKFFLGC